MQECTENKADFTSFYVLKSIFHFLLKQTIYWYIIVKLMMSQVCRCCFKSSGCVLKLMNTTVIL